MHLERFRATFAHGKAPIELDLRAGDGHLHRWNVLPRFARGSPSLWPFLALAFTGTRRVKELSAALPEIRSVRWDTAEVEFVLVRHPPQETSGSQAIRAAGGWSVDGSGALDPMASGPASTLDPTLPRRKPPLGANGMGWLFVGYGPRWRTHDGTDAFDFADPGLRIRRFTSLWNPAERLTDPVAFIERLRFKGVRYGRPRSYRFLERLSQALCPRLGLAPDHWLEWESPVPWRRLWEGLMPCQQRPLEITLDLARHVLDASARLDEPSHQTGVVVLDRPHLWGDPNELPAWVTLWDRLFPQLQFLVGAPDMGPSPVPRALEAQRFPIPAQPPTRTSRTLAPAVLSPRTVLLVDVDSGLPNLALMKLSRQCRDRGRPVRLLRPGERPMKAREVHASCVFAFPNSARRVESLRAFYGEDLDIGGSGVDLRRRLPQAIEDLPPDFSLYPELGDRAIGFLTRGCPLRCPFCIVPVKEGQPRRVADLDQVLQGRRKLILLDDNLLSHPSAIELLEEMARRELAVNFNQTLDLRFLDPAAAALLRRIRCSNVDFTRRNYYFSLNGLRGLDRVRERYALLEVTGADNVEFVCIYGFDTTLAEDVERFTFLRSLPRAYVFVQRYRRPLGGPEADLSAFFDDRADERIDALLRVTFTQNMKSMETYYRWLCLLYARQCRRIHPRLVETLFRYNGRHRMGTFLEKLRGICAEPAGSWAAETAIEVA